MISNDEVKKETRRTFKGHLMELPLPSGCRASSSQINLLPFSLLVYGACTRVVKYKNFILCIMTAYQSVKLDKYP